MRTFVFFLLMMLPVLSFANETGQIEGKITLGDEKEVLAGADVFLVKTKFRTTTNENGEFIFNHVPPGKYTVCASYVGYKTEKIKDIVVESGKNTALDIFLPEIVFPMDEVVVTGSLFNHLLKDTPVITEVVSRTAIKDVGSSNLVDVMREQTGLEISYGIGRTQSAQLNGLTDAHVLVLVDGERTTGKVDGAIDLGQIPVHQIERIEVVKGPISSIYGSEAMGGVINIITKDPAQSPLFSSNVTFGSYGRQDYIFSAARAFQNFIGKDQHLKLFVSGGLNKRYEIDYDEKDNFHELPELDRRNINVKVHYRYTHRFDLSLKTDLYTDESTWLEGDPNYVLRDVASNDKLGFLGMGTYHFTPTMNIKLVGNYSKNDHTFEEYTAVGYQVKDNLTTEVFENYKAQLTLIPYSVSILSFGFERIEESVESDRVDGQKKGYDTNVLYVEDEWSYAQHTLTIGGRYSDNSDYGTFFAPKISLMYRLHDHLKFRLSYGRGFRQPSIKELYIDYDNTGVGYKVVGEPDLKPEKSDGYNVGVEYSHTNKIWFRMNLYYNQLKDLISYYTKSQDGERAILSYYNINKATTRGINIDVSYNPTNFASFNVGYAYTLAENNDGVDLPFRVPHAINWKVGLTHEEWGIRGNFRGRWYDEKPVLDEQTNVNIYTEGEEIKYSYIPSYVILDAKIEKTIYNYFEIFAGINNLTDEKYFPFGQIKGRDFYAGLTITLK